MKILLVEDEVHLALAVSEILKKNGYEVDAVYDGLSGYEYAKSNVYDLVILDIMLPKMSGIDILRNLRSEKFSFPILMLTAKDEIEDKVSGLDYGADDYMTKPFSTDELIWRINALLRRANINRDKKIQIGNFVLDTESYTLHSKDVCIDFPKKEFDILFKLLSYPDRIFSKEELHDSIWGVNSESKEETVKTHINRIRNKLSNISEISIINIKGGYTL